jgi:hypothetical protein
MTRRDRGKSAPTPVPPATPRRDPRPVIYFALDQLFVVIYAVVTIKVIPNRLPSASAHLWSLSVFTQVMGIGTILVVGAPTRRIGWWVAIVGGSLLLASTVLLIVRILVSAAFLAGVYGAFGTAAATGALVGAALVIELVAILPIVQVKYLMSRAGRRAYGHM